MSFPRLTRVIFFAAVCAISFNAITFAQLRGIFIDVGEKEEFSHIRITTGLFSRALSEQNIPHAFEIYPKGTHGSLVRQRLQTRVFQFFSEKLDFTNPN
jgi:hypothetical protein